MKKITRHGYVIHKSILSEKEKQSIRKDLTLIPKKKGGYGKLSTAKQFDAYKESKEWMVVPKFYGLSRWGEPETDRLSEHENVNIKYQGKLRDYQEEAVEKTISGIKTKRGGLLIAGCGTGKTNMALYIAAHFNVKTLFLVHREFLADQIEERALAFTNQKKLGRIQGDIVDIDHDMVIGIIQSIAKDKYDRSIFSSFNLIVVDEVHHMGAEFFSNVFSIVGSKWTLGISAEKTRKDGMFKLINWNMGEILSYQEQAPNSNVIVKRFEYFTSNKKRSKTEMIPFSDNENLSKMVTNLTHIRKRNVFLLNLITCLHEMGRKVLVLSARLLQVGLFQKKLPMETGLYIGNMDKDIRKEETKKMVILANIQMAEEALDIPDLDVVVFASPVPNPKQAIGRILRKDEYDIRPLVIDVVDADNETFTRHSECRNRYYARQKYDVHTFKVSDNHKPDTKHYRNKRAIKKCLRNMSDFEKIPDMVQDYEEIEYKF